MNGLQAHCTPGLLPYHPTAQHPRGWAAKDWAKELQSPSGDPKAEHLFTVT